MNYHRDVFIQLMALSRHRYTWPILPVLLLLPVASDAGLVCAHHAAKQAAIQKNIPPLGNYQALVIFARFADEAAAGGDDAGSAAPSFATNLFDPDLPGSLTHFYAEMSAGQLAITGQVLPRWYSSDQAGSAYVETDGRGRYEAFVRDILNKVDAEVDLGRFDNDGPDGIANSEDDDGFVDLIFVNLLSTPPGFIIGGATGVANLGLDFDFQSNDRRHDGTFTRIRSDRNRIAAGGTLQRGHTFEFAVGSMAHEFGHLLGLPDLFDLDFNAGGNRLEPRNDSAGIGYWGLMGRGAIGWNELDGPNPFCAWSLQQLGWLGRGNERLIPVEENLRGVVIDDVRNGGNIYQLPGSGEGHYYLVLHRRPDFSYYERNLPGSGLLVWEINSEQGTNNREEGKLVDLVCADGRYLDAGFPVGRFPSPEFGSDNLDFWAHDEAYRLERAGNLGDATDFFDGVTATRFWAGSNPSPRHGLGLHDIRRQDDTMVADFVLDDPSRAGLVDGDERWDGEIVVVGDVTVAANSSLYIGPGAKVTVDRDFRGTGRDPERVEFIVDGEFGIGALRGKRTTMTSAAAEPMPGDWHGITVETSGRVDLKNTTIRHVRTGVGGSAVVPPQLLQNVEISQATHSGVDMVDLLGTLIANDVEIAHADSQGLSVTGSANVIVADSEFRNNGLIGLNRAGGRMTLTNSHFADNGLEEEEGANLELGPGTLGEVFDNQFARGVGIRCRASRQVTIKNNQMIDSSIGLHSVSSRPWVEGNQFLRNDLAMRVSGLEVPAFLALNIVEENDRLVENTSVVDLVARNNWWGRIDEVWIGERISGEVSWQPILNVDPRIPVDFSLTQNYPNPFNGSTVIGFAVGIETPILVHELDMLLEIRNVTGGLVRKLVSEKAAPGRYSVLWNGENDAGDAVASGVYLSVLRVGPIVRSHRLMVLK